MAAIPSSSSLLATHYYYPRLLGSAPSNSSCRSAQYPGEAIPHGPASFLGSPLFHSWPQCWESPEQTESN
ncbi:pancreatic progenitor cell differentiation and proliferation factor-like [Sciurus carolinensis]|uniref:pancreatic progenitor cell differentiation and proliferation factor-like n=1 Tax=Sciurus carolinensis TaxID=30640 RepID=UPI001FB276F9|nr:pancreatic progenitor cell differentiation and proliferation factor-like [Sciurus carolinensis]